MSSHHKSKQVTQIEGDLTRLRTRIIQAVQQFYDTHGTVPEVKVLSVSRLGQPEVLAGVHVSTKIGDPT